MMTYVGRLRALAAVMAVSMLAIMVLAQVGKQADRRAEDVVRAVALQYFMASIEGDRETYARVCRFPLTIIRDGVVKTRDEKQSAAMLGEVAKRVSAVNLDDEARKTLTTNVVASVDQGTLEFLGARTACLSFLTEPPRKTGDGEKLVQLVLFREASGWKVIVEISDAEAVPASYYSEPKVRP